MAGHFRSGGCGSVRVIRMPSAAARGEGQPGDEPWVTGQVLALRSETALMQ